MERALLALGWKNLGASRVIARIARKPRTDNPA
jgi:hypothetical protein